MLDYANQGVDTHTFETSFKYFPLKNHSCIFGQLDNANQRVDMHTFERSFTNFPNRFERSFNNCP